MQAVEVSRLGGPDVLTVVERPDPVPGAGEIAIDVSHAAVGLIDVFFRQGLYADRPGMPQPPFVPGLEVAGTGGYASVYIAPASRVVPAEGLDPAVAVAVVPNAAMAHVALTHVVHLANGERVLVLGALGGFSSAFPGMARQLGAETVVGAVRPGRPASSRLPYDRITTLDALGGETFDIIVDPVGGDDRTRSLDLLAAGGRLLAAGNASADWNHRIDSNRLWGGSITVAGFNAGAYLPAHPETIRPALEAAVAMVADGRGDIEVDVLPPAAAAEAHARMEGGARTGRIVLRFER